MDMITVLQELVSAHGVSGSEFEIAQLIGRLAAPYVDECARDVLGNLICYKRGNGPKVMFAAHMDSVGLMVTHIEPEGFIRVGKLGGIHPADVLNTMVRTADGATGGVRSSSDDLAHLKPDDLYVDFGAKNRAEAEMLVRVGDTLAYTGQAARLGTRIVSPYLDDRIGCLVLLMAMEQISQSPNDLVFAFTVQEEVGRRGSKTAAFRIAPDYGIAVDVTGADDIPGSKHGCSARLGEGAGIKMMDASVICHPMVTKHLNDLAKENGIPVQPDVLRSGGTDAGSIQLSGMGTYTGGISIPCRGIHTPTELVDQSDVESCVRLTTAFAMSALPKEK